MGLYLGTNQACKNDHQEISVSRVTPKSSCFATKGGILQGGVDFRHSTTHRSDKCLLHEVFAVLSLKVSEFWMLFH